MSANEVFVASTAADSEAVEAVRTHHAELVGQVAMLTDSLLSAAERGGDIETNRTAVLGFATNELLPHGEVAAERLYPAAARTDRARPLIESMIARQRGIGVLVEQIRNERSPLRMIADAHALRVLVEAQLGDEADRLLPIVAADSEVSVAEVTAGMTELVGHGSDEHGGHQCACAEDDSDVPVLDVRTIPHAIRHATVFGAFDAVPPGAAMELIAHHDPIPLLHQLEQRSNGGLVVSYIERGPEVWRLMLGRR
ncbi:DUF2249 domain-containing protein [Mycobacterium koreense]|uniref:Cation-binding protein n=1 Tax=Mycolicibacillus koreensis TaxID=1069220 RepID=A0A7I7SH95_9MYCO|nr:DUF2249 domain-containing protein [Mycolicibacillus koreensis]MCV7248657.1 DUF2249 domain-containing protein [Mycolicibacillus koreensis]OSC33990.1 cation-binding protein [Mycolicibacillus koreensis]BBY55619.1 hypothetical protein MKOR_28700 [Mycolicibacillus koreensis]